MLEAVKEPADREYRDMAEAAPTLKAARAAGRQVGPAASSGHKNSTNSDSGEKTAPGAVSKSPRDKPEGNPRWLHR
jgi:hypothetical protein